MNRLLVELLVGLLVDLWVELLLELSVQLLLEFLKVISYAHNWNQGLFLFLRPKN